MQNTRTYSRQLPAIALEAKFGIENFFHILQRSDHFPFWESKIPALMWTDTAEYRNPHYHKKSDTVDTINFPFLAHVTRSLLACVLEEMV